MTASVALIPTPSAAHIAPRPSGSADPVAAYLADLDPETGRLIIRGEGGKERAPRVHWDSSQGLGQTPRLVTQGNNRRQS